MTGPDRRRTLPVRGWFALAAITTFAMVAAGVLASVLLFGVADLSSQDRVAAAETILRDGAARWSDPAWRQVTTARLDADGVSFALFEDGVELYRSTDATDRTDGRMATDGVWRPDDGDGIVRAIEIDGTSPPLTAQIYAPLDGEDPVPGIIRATLAIGGVAAIVSLMFGRIFVRPLRAVRDAAKQVTDGDLTVRLPRSRITEVDEVTTEFDLMTVELSRSLEQQAEIEAERRIFIAAVAHDLRTPLFSLRGYLEGLETGVADTPEKRARYLAIANDKARALEILVADLFDYTRLEYLDQSLELAQLDLVGLLRDVVDSLRPQADAEGLTLDLLSQDLPCPIEADRDQLVRAATNVVANALRYTPAGGRVEVTCEASADRAWFAVTDTGPGIDPADLPHLFRPLYRGDRTRGGATGGAGLGLAIAQRILTAHDGTLEAANNPAGGATFTATLPRSVGV